MAKETIDTMTLLKAAKDAAALALKSLPADDADLEESDGDEEDEVAKSEDEEDEDTEKADSDDDEDDEDEDEGKDKKKMPFAKNKKKSMRKGSIHAAEGTEKPAGNSDESDGTDDGDVEEENPTEGKKHGREEQGVKPSRQASGSSKSLSDDPDIRKLNAQPILKSLLTRLDKSMHTNTAVSAHLVQAVSALADVLSKQNARLAKSQEVNRQLSDRLERLEKQPMPRKTFRRSVEPNRFGNDDQDSDQRPDAPLSKSHLASLISDMVQRGEPDVSVMDVAKLLSSNGPKIDIRPELAARLGLRH